MKTPCKIIVWNIVPFIKKEFAKEIVNEFGLNQRETAKKLGTTEATISRYISGKRGALEITDKEILKEIHNSAERITKGNVSTAIEETCRICKLLKSLELVDGINFSCE